LTAEQLEAARAERMRQNGHGAITIEDVRTWIEETGLSIFLPRSAQAGFTAPTFVEAVAGQRTTEPTLELIASAESLLVRLEAEGVAVRLNLGGQPGGSSSDQPDYVVAGWVLPYIYALRGDRDWRRSPQLTGSRQVSPLAVQAAKQLDSANMTATQIRDALGRETTEAAVLRALHELWKQLRIIPVVPEVGQPALWQPLRQRFQKAIAEGASTSQVTAISVLASIYLQAVIAASMEDVEMFLSPLTSRSKIREVVRGLAATRQVHSTSMGHSPMYYVAGTLPEFPAVPSYQSGASQSSYSSGYAGSGYGASSYRSSGNRASNGYGSNNGGPAYPASYLDEIHEEEHAELLPKVAAHAVEEIPSKTIAAPQRIVEPAQPKRHEAVTHGEVHEHTASSEQAKPGAVKTGHVNAGHDKTGHVKTGHVKTGQVKAGSGKAGSGKAGSGKAGAPRPRSIGTAHPRERGRVVANPSEGRSSAGDRRRAPAPRSGSSSRSASGASATRNHNGFSSGNGHHKHTSNASPVAKSNGISKNGAGKSGQGNGAHTKNGAAPKPVRAAWNARPAGKVTSKATKAPAGARSASRSSVAGKGVASNGRHSSSGNSAANGHKNGGLKSVGSNGHRSESRTSAVARPSVRSASRPAAAADAKRKPATASAAKRYSFAGQAKQAPKPAAKRGSVSKAKTGSSRPSPAKRRG